MAGAVDVIEWLHVNGLPVTVESAAGVTPLEVALQYKKMSTARRIQHLRDAKHTQRPIPLPLATPIAGERAESHASRESLTTSQPNIGAERQSVISAMDEVCPARHDEVERRLGGTQQTPPESPLRDPPSQLAWPEVAKSSAPEIHPSHPHQPHVGVRPDLAVANRDAAQQLLAAGEQAMRAGNLRKAVRLLVRAKGLDGTDVRYGAALAEAEAMLREVEREARLPGHGSGAHEQHDFGEAAPSRGANESALPAAVDSLESNGTREFEPGIETASGCAPTHRPQRLKACCAQLAALLLAMALRMAAIATHLFVIVDVAPTLVMGLRAASRLAEALDPFQGNEDLRERLKYLLYYWWAVWRRSKSPALLRLLRTYCKHAITPPCYL